MQERPPGTAAKAGQEIGSPVRNTTLLSVSQAMVGSSQGIIASVGGLTGAVLSGSPALATVPNTIMILGLALSAAPATFLIYRLGRRTGFMLGASLAIVGGLGAAYAVYAENFILFCAALVFAGASSAFAQQYRFAAADSVSGERKARAISFVLLGGIAAGFLGPRLAFLARDLIPGAEFSGSFLMIAVLAVVSIAVLSQTRLAPVVRPAHDAPPGRSTLQLLRSPGIFVPIITGMISYALMTFIMIAAPLAMVFTCGHSTEQATFTIQWHIIAMFAPSFVTGTIISRIGTHLTAGLGLVLILASAMIALNGITTWHFDFALILLGVGWNFGFIGSTTMLTTAYAPQEAGRVQALNEQLVFGTMALASISSGVLLQWIGWQAINILSIPVATGAIALLAWSDGRIRARAGV